MASSLTTSFSLLFILFNPFLALGSKPMPFEGSKAGACFKFTVHVINGFSSNAQPLLLNCWSKDDQLGNHTLYNGGDFHFKFGLTILGKTKFQCDFKWAEKHQHVDVFTDGKESDLCCDTNSCYWKAEDDGIYFCNDNQSYVKKFDCKNINMLLLLAPIEITLKMGCAKGFHTKLEIEISSIIECVVSEVIFLRPAMELEWLFIVAKAIDDMNPKLEAKGYFAIFQGYWFVT
ncbi:unnamed protein product [Dovyalis caffra]|uniref:S-protein homolog n=1 Tax=Dovyalis caffra TaxID=77055 RepID=A0AAV1RUQ3_9ROSI|nr:unnamed protein product [Dovyalis caffra]